MEKKGKWTKTKVAYLNKNQYGQLWSEPINAAALDALSKIEPGAKLVVDCYDSKDKPGEKVFVLNVIPAAEIQASEAAYQARKQKAATAPTVDI